MKLNRFKAGQIYIFTKIDDHFEWDTEPEYPESLYGGNLVLPARIQILQIKRHRQNSNWTFPWLNLLVLNYSNNQVYSFVDDIPLTKEITVVKIKIVNNF